MGIGWWVSVHSDETTAEGGDDDVGGGLPRMIDMFFHESKAAEFSALDDIGMKREYF